MKFVAAILAVLVMFLSMTANCTDCCPDGDTCTHETEQHEAENTSHDCQNTCSPFSICNTCVGFIVIFFDNSPAKPQEISKEINLYPQTFYYLSLVKDIWQPPKFA